MKRTLIVAAAFALVCAPAFAGELFNVSGVGKGTSQSSVAMVGEGHMLMNSINSYKNFESVDPKSPFSGMTGQCWGAIEIKIPSASGRGHCEFTDKSGDKSYNTWVATGLAKDGALTGTWTLIGGTGKYKNATGGGQFHSRTDREAGTFENEVEGALILK
jgi:hypothetical protein